MAVNRIAMAQTRYVKPTMTIQVSTPLTRFSCAGLMHASSAKDIYRVSWAGTRSDNHESYLTSGRCE